MFSLAGIRGVKWQYELIGGAKREKQAIFAAGGMG